MCLFDDALVVGSFVHSCLGPFVCRLCLLDCLFDSLFDCVFVCF